MGVFSEGTYALPSLDSANSEDNGSVDDLFMAWRFNSLDGLTPQASQRMTYQPKITCETLKTPKIDFFKNFRNIKLIGIHSKFLLKPYACIELTPMLCKLNSPIMNSPDKRVQSRKQGW